MSKPTNEQWKIALIATIAKWKKRAACKSQTTYDDPCPLCKIGKTLHWRCASVCVGGKICSEGAHITWFEDKTQENAQLVVNELEELLKTME